MFPVKVPLWERKDAVNKSLKNVMSMCVHVCVRACDGGGVFSVLLLSLTLFYWGHTF